MRKGGLICIHPRNGHLRDRLLAEPLSRRLETRNTTKQHRAMLKEPLAAGLRPAHLRSPAGRPPLTVMSGTRRLPRRTAGHQRGGCRSASLCDRRERRSRRRPWERPRSLAGHTPPRGPPCCFGRASDSSEVAASSVGAAPSGNACSSSAGRLLMPCCLPSTGGCAAARLPTRS
jgi:hypothetical protein